MWYISNRTIVSSCFLPLFLVYGFHLYHVVDKNENLSSIRENECKSTCFLFVLNEHGNAPADIAIADLIAILVARLSHSMIH